MKKGNSNENPFVVDVCEIKPDEQKDKYSIEVPTYGYEQKKSISKKEPLIEISTIPYVLHMEAEKIIRRLTKEGKILTDSKEEKEEEPIK